MDWTWLLIIVGLMFVMHRSGMGCHGGHTHEGHGGRGHGEENDRPQHMKIEALEKSGKPAAAPVRAPGAGMGCCGGHQEAERGGGETGKSSLSREVEATEMKTADAVSALAESGKQGT